MKILLAPLFVCTIGVVFFVIAMGAPAFVGSRIGPGLFARIFAAGVIGLSLVWLAGTIFVRGQHGEDEQAVAQRLPLTPAVALLGAVILFIVLRPLAGLVLTCALAGLSASWGAGERTVLALAASTVVAGGIALIIAALLLPEATPLWPWSPHL